MNEKTPNNIYKIPPENAEMRLDRLLQHLKPELNFGPMQKLCRTGQVRLDGKRVKGKERVAAGQELRLPPHFLATDNKAEVSPEAVKNEQQLSAKDWAWLQEAVLFRDDDMIALNKPAGIPVQAGSGHTRSLDRLMNAFCAPLKPRLVHRLDKATSGVLVFALNRESAASLTKQFASREAQKTYLAALSGALLDGQGTLDFALEKTAADDGYEQMKAVYNARRAENIRGQQAKTVYKRLQRTGSYQLIEAKPETGRTHQLRAHFSIMGAPIVGDRKYGGEGYKYKNKNTMLLHARTLEIIHPKTRQSLKLSAPLPEPFQAFCRAREWESGFIKNDKA